MAKSVCVIGCGVSGLVSIKSCLEEGHLVTCYEKYDKLGGTWDFSDERKPGQGAAVFCRLHMISSKELSRFSDFPMPHHYPPLLTRQMALAYLQGYAKQFDLLEHVSFNTEVISVTPADDYDVTGSWLVKTRSISSGFENAQVFDRVVIASGYFHKAFQPSVPGQECFRGKITHSIDFRRGEEYAGKRVVVVGSGPSASDVAMDVALFASRVILAVGNGMMVIPPFTANNEPCDFLVSRSNCLNMFQIIKRVTLKHLDYSRTGLAEREVSGFTVSGNIETFIGSGKIEVQGHIERLERSTAFFTDGAIAEVDHVIMATGFLPDYSFLDKPVLPANSQDTTLYKLVWPTNVKHSTLAVIGYFSAVGALWPVMEMQARWVALVFSGKRHLPTKSFMREHDGMKDILFPQNERGTVRLFATPYMDLIAEEVGCKPNILHYLFKDPVVAWKLLTGPLFPAAYRMQGPHATNDARNQFLKGYDLTVNASRRRKMTPPKVRSRRKYYFLLGIFATGMIMWYCYKRSDFTFVKRIMRLNV